MLSLYTKIWIRLHREDGQGMVEYGLIIGLVSVAVVAALVIMGPKLKALFDAVNTNLPTP